MDHDLAVHWTPRDRVGPTAQTDGGQATAQSGYPQEKSGVPATVAVSMPPARTVNPNSPPDAGFSHTLTLRSTYRSSSTTLAGAAFFGASLSYSAVFSFLSTSPAVLSWASALFLVGAVCAGGMSVLSNVDGVWPVGASRLLEKDPASVGPLPRINQGQLEAQTVVQGRRAQREYLVRGYGYASVLLVLTGLVCLNITVILGALEEGAGSGAEIKRGAARFRPAVVVAAGIFGIAGAVISVVGALFIRARYDDFGQQFYHIETQPADGGEPV